MSKLVVLKLGDGDLHQGFSVTLQLGEENQRHLMEIPGRLPNCLNLINSYIDWQSAYRQFITETRLGKLPAQLSNFSTLDINRKALELTEQLNQWLNSELFQSLREKLLEQLKPDEQVRLIIQTSNFDLQRLPWYCWSFFERYPKAEVAISGWGYEQVKSSQSNKKQVNILAILGNNIGINLEENKKLLENLPQTQVNFLIKPDLQELTNKLWETSWDIIFFAGHSRTECQQGIIELNDFDSLTIAELKNALRRSLAQGLKLAIFNSCDGLGLAQALADLHIPQVIVMREPVPDRVAQEFLKYFLNAFAGGKSLYLAVREARERLQGIENYFPCSSWLPVIFQNPTQELLTWNQLLGKPFSSSSNPSFTQLERYSLRQLPYCSLPIQTNEFIGRTRELKDLLKFISLSYRAPIITVDGIGGVGKTTLVVEAAYRCWEAKHGSVTEAPVFDAIIFASFKENYLLPSGIVSRLQRQSSLQDIFMVIASTLDDQTITQAAPEDQINHVYQSLSKQKNLLIVDNLETIFDKNLVLAFLSDLPPSTKAVITTREQVVMYASIRLDCLTKAGLQAIQLL